MTETFMRLSFLAACAFALAVVLDVLAAALFAALGTILLAISFDGRAEHLAPFLSELRLTAALVAVALVAALVPGALNGVTPTWVIVAVPLIVVLLALAELTGTRTRRYRIATAVTVIAVVLIAGISMVRVTKDMGIDVVQLHKQAAAALARGENPYGAAVSVPNGSPGVPAGSTIVGYPYPPIVAVVYASSAPLLGDPRWASLASWIVVAMCGLELFWWRRRDAGSAMPFLLLAVLPGWGMMLQSGWTEMLSCALIAVAAVTWRRPIVSGIALGAALGSKQYFVVTLPLLVLYRGIGWERRAATAIATILLCLLPAFVWGPSDAWQSLVLFHTHTPPRTDSSNLVGVLGLLGIHWNPPVWLGIGVSVTLVSVLARRATDSAGFWRAMAAGLAVFFLFSSQAMPNYWFLVAVIAVLGSQPRSPSETPS
jgi:uncharacterized membrane protein